MILTVIGGGGFRTPMVCRAFSHREADVEEIRLYDPSPDRLRVIQAVLAGQPGAPSTAPLITAFTDLDAALLDADFVFMAIRVGGLAGRSWDERQSVQHGFIGQETTGAAGIVYGMRTVPVAVAIARKIADICPDACVINFTNPVGMITEAMAEVLGDQVIGVCDTPRALGTRVADALAVDAEELRLDYVGLNHLGWVRAAIKDDFDLLPALLADDVAANKITEVRVLGLELVRLLGTIPNEYLYFYYYKREALELLRHGQTRGEFLLKQQGDFYEQAASHEDEAYQIWRRAASHRNALYMAELRNPDLPSSPIVQHQSEGQSQAPSEFAAEGSRNKHRRGGYEGVARSAIIAIATDQRTDMILNVRNRGAIPQLDSDAVVEVSCSVDSQGAKPLPVAPLTLHQLGLMNQVKAVERLGIEAAMTGSYSAAWSALALHPLVDSAHVARKLLDEFLKGSPELGMTITPRGSHTLKV